MANSECYVSISVAKIEQIWPFGGNDQRSRANSAVGKRALSQGTRERNAKFGNGVSYGSWPPAPAKQELSKQSNRSPMMEVARVSQSGN